MTFNKKNVENSTGAALGQLTQNVEKGGKKPTCHKCVCNTKVFGSGAPAGRYWGRPRSMGMKVLL